MRDRRRWFSITAKDCKFIPYKGSGAGGQKKNKTSSAIHCFHKASGAKGSCESYREQIKNKREAFKRMANSVEFQSWLNLKIEAGKGKIEIKEGEAAVRKLRLDEV